MYCAITDIQDSISEKVLVDLVNDETAAWHDFTDPEDPLSKRVLKVIADVDEEINGYLRQRFALPLPQNVGILNKIAIDISVFYLYSRRPSRNGLPERLERAYERRISQLKDIQKGTISLGVEELTKDTPLNAESLGCLTNKVPEDRIFSNIKLDAM